MQHPLVLGSLEIQYSVQSLQLHQVAYHDDRL
jgi:hypothetical protein